MGSKRENNFGILRLAAALTVLSGHTSALTGTPVIYMFGDMIQSMGTRIFFLAGGYLIAKSWLSDPHPVRYGIKRFMRIWPPLAVCVLFCMFLLGPAVSSLSIQEYLKNPGLGNYFWNLRLFPFYSLPGCFETNPYPSAVNGSLWTLPVEVFMYFAVALSLGLLSKLGSRNTRVTVTGIAILTALAIGLRLYILKPVWGWEDRVVYGTSLTSAMVLIPYYLIGCLYALAVPQKMLNLPLAVAAALCSCCFMNQDPVLMELFRMAVIPYLVFSLAFCDPVIHLPAWMECSYGIYLYGFPIQQALIWGLQKLGMGALLGNMPLLTALSLLCVLPFALLSKYLVENPCGQLCKKLCQKIK